MTILVFGPIQMAMDMRIKLAQTYLMIVQISLVHPSMMYADVSTRMAMVGLMNRINIQMMHRNTLLQKILTIIRLYY